MRRPIFFFRALGLLLCALCVLGPAGCKKILPDGDGHTVSTGQRGGPGDALAEAKNALASGRYAQAELLAERNSRRTDISREQVVESLQILAKAAAYNNHPNLALSALDQWASARPGADGEAEWQNTWCFAAGQLSAREAANRAESLYGNESRSPGARAMAGVFLAVRQWEEGRLGQTVHGLESMYASTRDSRVRIILEQRLALELHKARTSAVALVGPLVTPENQGRYPYSIILVDQVRRQTLDPVTRAEAQATLERLSREITLADPTLFRGLPSEQPSVPAVSGPRISGRPVVLALPLSGQYAGVAGKIVAGAEAARDEFAASGTPVSLIVIDTEQPDWLSRVESLPPGAAVVGGPLRTSDYVAAHDRGITGQRAFFTFLPSLDGSDEGRVAWRFFTSPADQVDTLLQFTAGLGITGYATLYPDEPYGRRMATLFAARAGDMGGYSVREASYPPSEPNDWLGAVAGLVGRTPSRTPAFQAIFLPDSWKNMDILVPNIFYYDETRQVLLGTSLWEQGLAGKHVVSPQYYGLAVFPGAWNPVSASPAAQRLQSALAQAGKPPADFWSGLGYDFARFSATLNIGEGWTPGSVNAALSTASVNWSMAPIRWDAGGRAAQELFLFTPSPEYGFIPVNNDEFRQRFNASWR